MLPFDNDVNGFFLNSATGCHRWHMVQGSDPPPGKSSSLLGVHHDVFGQLRPDTVRQCTKPYVYRPMRDT